MIEVCTKRLLMVSSLWVCMMVGLVIVYVGMWLMILDGLFVIGVLLGIGNIFVSIGYGMFGVIFVVGSVYDIGVVIGVGIGLFGFGSGVLLDDDELLL